MTTRVTVDAHAGWPVMVTMIVGEEIRIDVVVPFTTKDFYIHSGMRIVNIKELPKN